MESYNLVSFAGIIILLVIAWLLSPNKRDINWRVLTWGVGLQLVFAAFIFWVPAGSRLFLIINDVVVKILSSATAGTEFLFGPLALATGEKSIGFILAFQGLPTVVFFSALMALLYYYNIMPKLIHGFAYVFTKLMRLSGAESLCASSNIFVGVEAPLTIQPHLKKMTDSELHTILTTCMATIASTVLGLYVFMLRDTFPTIAGHLVSASILSAPAAVVMSKLLLPETETPETLGVHVQPHYEKENNAIESVINGANTGVKLALSIAGMLLAFLGLVALADLLFGSAGNLINKLSGLNIEWTFKNILGYLFYPVSLILGIPPADALEIAKLLGERLVVTELTAYQDLAVVLKNGTLMHPRSALICTYALCGFAHVASLAIFVGGIAALVPERTHQLAKLAPRALLAATLACLMTGAVAGTFFHQTSILLSQ